MTTDEKIDLILRMTCELIPDMGQQVSLDIVSCEGRGIIQHSGPSYRAQVMLPDGSVNGKGSTIEDALSSLVVDLARRVKGMVADRKERSYQAAKSAADIERRTNGLEQVAALLAPTRGEV